MAAEAHGPQALAWREQRRWGWGEAAEAHGLLLALMQVEQMLKERG